MAAGDTTLVAGQTKAQYRGLNSNLIGQAFDALLDVTKSNSDILSQLQGSMGSDKPFVLKDDLSKGAKDIVHFNVGTSLGQAGRRGTQVAVNYEEPLFHNSWQVQIDSLRVVVGWNEITQVVATTGQSWEEVYAQLVGQRVGQIEQEDMLMRMRQRSGALNTLRPGNRTTLDGIHYDDTLDTLTMNRAITTLGTLGAKPAMIGKMTGGMPLNRYVCLGSNTALEPIWNDPTFTQALLHAAVDGPTNAYWTGDLPDWRGTIIKRWDIVNHDNPGAIGSTIQPQAILGDSSASGGGNSINGTPTAAITVYGGGRTQASLGNAAALYKPFEYFYGCDKLFGESISVGADANVYYFIIIDPADGKWNLYSYTGSAAFGSNGNSVVTTNNLAAAASGTAVTTLGNWTWDGTKNKEAFPAGSLIVQVNANVAPVGDVFVFGADAGAKAYGKVKNKRIKQLTDYEALVGYGVHTIYGADMRQDTLGKYRGFMRLQCAYELPGFTLPQL
jgi:hypothetical protein